MGGWWGFGESGSRKIVGGMPRIRYGSGLPISGRCPVQQIRIAILLPVTGGLFL